MAKPATQKSGGCKVFAVGIAAAAVLLIPYFWSDLNRPVEEYTGSRGLLSVASFRASNTAAASINLDALDGTAGRQGPRTWNDSLSHSSCSSNSRFSKRRGGDGTATAVFEDTTKQLSAQEQRAYQEWVTWAEKPAGLDYIQPSVTHFSLGKTRAFKGDLNQPGNMRAMLEARSYRKEIIHFCMAGTGVADIGLNFIFNLRALGYDHWVAYASNEEECDRLEAAVGHVGCVWNSIFNAEDAPEAVRSHQGNTIVIWVLRWLHVARIVRLGYNVALLDTDLMIHDDMYKYLKGPLMADLNWICGDEDYGIGCNGGTNYIQNATPNGPAAWMAGTMADWMLRLLESPEQWTDTEHTRGVGWATAVMDQSMLSSLVRSAFTGLYIMPHLYRGLDEAAIEQAEKEHPWDNYDENRMMPMPEEWKGRFQADELGARFTNISVPQRQLTPVLTAPRKSFSQRYWDLLREESGAPMWPDSDRLQEAADIPRELLGKTLDFTIQTFKTGYQCGRWWGQKPPRGVIGHTVLIPDGSFARTFLFKVLGWWSWKIDQLMVDHYDRPGYYPVSTAEQQHPPLLLYAPSLQMQNITSDQWRAALIGLVTAGQLLKRRIVWPLLPCGTEWLVNNEDPAAHEGSPFLQESRWCHVPKGCTCGVHDHWFGTPWHWLNAIPIVDDNYPLSRKACVHWRGWDPKCGSETLMYPDFKHMLRHFPPSAAAATAQNTYSAEGLDSPRRLGFRQTSADELRQSAAGLEDQPVLYLGAAPLLHEAGAEDSELQRLHQICTKPVAGLNDEQFSAFLQEKLSNVGS